MPTAEQVIASRSMNPRQWVAVAVCIAVNAIDGFDILAASFAAPGFSKEWGLRADQLGLVLSMELIGMAAGSVFLGRLADMIGRRRTMILALTVISLAITFCGFARSISELALLRLATGVAMGVLIPAMTSMVAETSSDRHRDLAVSWMGAGYPVGATLGGAVAAVLLSQFDWRAVFFLGGVVTVGVLLLTILFVPESVPYLARRGGPEARERISHTLASFGKAVEWSPLSIDPGGKARSLHIPRKVIAAVVPLAAVYSFHMCTFYFILKWLPKIAVDRGYSQSEAAQVLVLANIGGAAGSVLVGFIAARLGARRVTIAALILSSLMVSIWGWSGSDFIRLAVLSVIASMFTNAGVVGFYAIMAASFPPEWRSTGIGFVIGGGRCASALAPILTGMLFQAGIDLSAVAVIIGSGSIIAAAIIALTQPRRIVRADTAASASI